MRIWVPTLASWQTRLVCRLDLTSRGFFQKLSHIPSATQHPLKTPQYRKPSCKTPSNQLGIKTVSCDCSYSNTLKVNHSIDGQEKAPSDDQALLMQFVEEGIFPFERGIGRLWWGNTQTQIDREIDWHVKKSKCLHTDPPVCGESVWSY